MMGSSGPYRLGSAAFSHPDCVALVADDGTRYPAAGIALVSGPHVLYNPPPSIGIGIGGFGFSGCCSAFGSGLGVGVPVGQPTPAEISDQYVASALIPSPPDYAINWSRYHVEVLAPVGRPWISPPRLPVKLGHDRDFLREWEVKYRYKLLILLRVEDRPPNPCDQQGEHNYRHRLHRLPRDRPE